MSSVLRRSLTSQIVAPCSPATARMSASPLKSMARGVPAVGNGSIRRPFRTSQSATARAIPKPRGRHRRTRACRGASRPRASTPLRLRPPRTGSRRGRRRRPGIPRCRSRPPREDPLPGACGGQADRSRRTRWPPAPRIHRPPACSPRRRNRRRRSGCRAREAVVERAARWIPEHDHALFPCRGERPTSREHDVEHPLGLVPEEPVSASTRPRLGARRFRRPSRARAGHRGARRPHSLLRRLVEELARPRPRSRCSRPSGRRPADRVRQRASPERAEGEGKRCVQGQIRSGCRVRLRSTIRSARSPPTAATLPPGVNAAADTVTSSGTRRTRFPVRASNRAMLAGPTAVKSPPVSRTPAPSLL